jgi:hypothetical protein
MGFPRGSIRWGKKLLQEEVAAVRGVAHQQSGMFSYSQWRRKRVEEIFAWVKTIAGLHKTRHRGIARVSWAFTFATAW